MSAVVSHLSLLDRVVRSVFRLSGGIICCDMWHIRRVVALSLFYRIRGSAGHSVGQLFPQLFMASRPTPAIILLCIPFTLVSPRCHTSQYLRTLIPVCVSLWNMLDESDFAGNGLGALKTIILWIVPLGYALINLFYLLDLQLLFILLFYYSWLSLILCTYSYHFSPLILLWACDSVEVFGLKASGP